MPNTYKFHDYNGLLPITVSIHKDFNFPSNITINGIKFEQPQIVAEIKKVIVSDVREDISSDYTDMYTSQQVSEGKVNGDPSRNNPLLGTGSYSDKVNQQITDYKLGWEASTYEKGITETAGATGQYQIIADTKGSFYDNTEPIDTFTFDARLRLKPEVTYDTQTFKLRSGTIMWDSVDTLFSNANAWLDGSPIESSFQRISSLHVTNHFVHQEFEVLVNFIATAKLSPEMSGKVLYDPFVKSGDFMWNAELGGNTGITVPFEAPFTDWLTSLFSFPMNIIIPLVITAIAVIIFRKPLMALIQRRKY